MLTEEAIWASAEEHGDTALAEPAESEWARVQQLVIEADELHVQAQTLNKQGRYQEATEAYTKFRQRDDEALEACLWLAREQYRPEVASTALADGPQRGVRRPTRWPAGA